MIPSYPKIWNIGHYKISRIFNTPVLVQEKIDGSQFSFGIIDGKLGARSKGADIYVEAPPKLFQAAIDVVQSIVDKLLPDHVYRGEYLSKPKHNTLAYERIPKNNIVLFDVQKIDEEFMEPDWVTNEANRIGLEPSLTLYNGKIESLEKLQELLEKDSILGGTKVEGVVIKNYEERDDHTWNPLMGKYVSEAFKEVHKGDWKQRNPGMTDVIERIISMYRTPARWEKAVFRMRDTGELLNEPKDIGPLIKSVQADTREETEDEVKEILFKYAWPKIQRRLGHGLAEWYKEKLAGEAFGETKLETE